MQEREGMPQMTPLNVQGMDNREEFGSYNSFTIYKKNGKNEFFDRDKVYASLKRAVKGVEEEISLDLIMQEITKNLHDKASTIDIEDAMVLAAIAFIERDPAYSLVASRLLRQKLSKEVIERSTTQENYFSHCCIFLLLL